MGIVRGNSRSRLSELRKYRRDGSLSDRYFTGGNRNVDGIDSSVSTEGVEIVYFIGGIRFRDIFNASGVYQETIFDYQARGCDTDDFVDLPIIKDFSKGDVVGKPEVETDVFIERQSISIFENQYRLRAVDNLSQLNFYAGGGYFNIIENT